MANRSRGAVESPAGSTMEPEFELTDEQWHLISDLFPESAVGPEGGRPTAPARDCVEGILWILRSGARWKDLPKQFPSATTCWRRHRDWTESCVWEKAWSRLTRLLDRRGRIKHEESFAEINPLGQQLTPYAVELRYDDEFWPPREVAREAVDAAITIQDFVLDRLPPTNDT